MDICLVGATHRITDMAFALAKTIQLDESHLYRSSNRQGKSTELDSTQLTPILETRLQFIHLEHYVTIAKVRRHRALNHAKCNLVKRTWLKTRSPDQCEPRDDRQQ